MRVTESSPMIAGASVSRASQLEGYNYNTFAEDLHQIVTQLKLRDFTLVGFSMGGGEVARYLGKYGSKGVPGRAKKGRLVITTSLLR